MVNIMKKDEAQARPAMGSRPSPFSLIDRFFDDTLWEPFAPLAPSLMGSRSLGGMSAQFPRVDVSETDKEINVVANIPGVDPNKVDVEVGDDYLSLSGRFDKESEDKDRKGRVYRYEREYGEFRREFSLPARVNKDGIVAKAKNGVLTLTLPKLEAERKTKVKVETER